MKDTARTVAGLLLLGTLLFLGAIAVSAGVRWFESLEKDTAVAFIGISGVVSVPVITYFSNRVLEQRRAVELATRSKRVELYESFVKFFMSLVSPEALGLRPDEEQTLQFLTDATPKLLTYASNRVVKLWGHLRLGSGTSPGGVDFLFHLEDFLKAMRKDLGHPGWSLQKGDLLRSFVNDIDDTLQRPRSSSTS